MSPDSPWRRIRGEFFLWEGIELFEKYNRGACCLFVLTLGLEFVADIPGADQDAVGLADFHVRDYILETLAGKVCDRRRRIGMAQHALRREDDERLAPVAQGLAAQQMKILRGVEGCAIWILCFAASCRNRSMRALECSGPWPS